MTKQNKTTQHNNKTKQNITKPNQTKQTNKHNTQMLTPQQNMCVTISYVCLFVLRWAWGTLLGPSHLLPSRWLGWPGLNISENSKNPDLPDSGLEERSRCFEDALWHQHFAAQCFG